MSVTRQAGKYLGGTKIMSFINIRKLIHKQRKEIVQRTVKNGKLKLSNNLTVAELCNALQMLSEEGLAQSKPLFYLSKKIVELSCLEVHDRAIVFYLKEGK